MKSASLLFLLPLLLARADLSAASECCPAPAASTEAKSPAGHPLRGVIVAVLADKSALLVKHEEIPGVMAAMTMLLKVDAATLAAAKKDQAITATLVRQDDGWWLRDVKPAPAAPEAASAP